MKYVIEDRDRHGNLRRYYWRKGRPKVRLRAEPGTPEFAAEVEAARIAIHAPAPQRPIGHYIYIVHAHGSGRVKIGIAQDAEHRLRELQVGSGTVLRLSRLYRAAHRDEAKRVERSVHLHLAKWRASGEWFRLRVGHAAVAVQGVADKLGISIDDMLIHRVRPVFAPTDLGGDKNLPASA